MRSLNRSLIAGLLFGVFAVGLAIRREIDGMSAAVFFHPVGIIVVFGGVLATALISTPLKEMGRIARRTYYVIRYPKDNFVETLRELIRVSVGANRDVMFLEKEAGNLANVLFKDGLNLIAMGFRVEDIKRFMEVKKDQNENAIGECSVFYYSLAKMGPAFGLLGTLIGLIILLYYHMGDGNMDKVASSMGIALTATLYGVGIANLIFSPLADYLQYNAERGAEQDQMIIEAIVQIKERKHPVYLLQALKAYMPREDYPEIDRIMQSELVSGKGVESSGRAQEDRKAS